MNPLVKSKKLRLILLLIILSAGGGPLSSAFAQTPAPFTIVGMPDIENETALYPAMLQSQVSWIVNNQTSSNIAFMAQQGDVVSIPDTHEYDTASSILFQLNNTSAPSLPWGILPGNHDTVDLNNYAAAINPSKFAGKSWYGGSDSYSSYQTFTAGNRNFLMIDVEYNPSTAVLDWAQSVITAHPGMPTLINTHDYLTASGTRSAMGDTIYSGSLTQNPNGLINGNSQVFMVLCGHVFTNPATLISLDKDGKQVFQCMADFQDKDTINYGDGYLRLYKFDEANSKISVSTYSPYDATTPYLTDTSDQFDFSMNFNDRLGLAVPEPSSLALAVMAGLGCLAGSRRRRLMP